MKLFTIILITSALSLVAAACGGAESIDIGSSEGGGDTLSFGDSDTVCQSVELRNDEGDEALLTSAQDCFLAERQAGNDVVVDINARSADGDPILHRFMFDAAPDVVTIIVDNRLDEFGSDRGITVEECASVVETNWLLEGVDCTPAV